MICVYLHITLDERQTPFTASIPHWQTAEIFVKPYVLARVRVLRYVSHSLGKVSVCCAESFTLGTYNTCELWHADKKEENRRCQI